MLKVFLGGEGNNDLGTRWRHPPGDSPGVIEALLRRARPDGWRVARAQDWKSIRKYRAGAARARPDWLARAKATFDRLIDGEDRR